MDVLQECHFDKCRNAVFGKYRPNSPIGIASVSRQFRGGGNFDDFLEKLGGSYPLGGMKSTTGSQGLFPFIIEKFYDMLAIVDL